MVEAQDPRDAVGRFINATEQAKDALGRKYDMEFSGLGTATRHAIKQGDRVVKQHASALQVLVELRNVIQHSRVNQGVPIAVPREDAIVAMEQIAAFIERQPQIKDHMVKTPATLRPSSSLQEASELVVGMELSQMPVYEGSTYVGLFTTNAMARWLSHAIQEGEGLLLKENVQVGEVLQHSEEHERAQFEKPTASALRVCETLSKDSAPPAVLVTTDGTAAGQLQGLVTRFDVPRIVRQATVTYP